MPPSICGRTETIGPPPRLGWLTPGNGRQGSVSTCGTRPWRGTTTRSKSAAPPGPSDRAASPLRSGDREKILEEVDPVPREKALGVELDAVDRVVAVADSHDFGQVVGVLRPGAG